MADSVTKFPLNSRSTVDGAKFFKCPQTNCSGTIFPPDLRCTLCHKKSSENGAMFKTTGNEIFNDSSLNKQPRLSPRSVTAPILILSVGRAGVFDARNGPCVINNLSISCSVKVEGVWTPVSLRSIDTQTLVFCQELQVILLKPRDALKRSLITLLKLDQSRVYASASMKWIVLVLGDRMAFPLGTQLEVQQLEIFGSVVRQNDGFCKMDCTEEDTKRILLDCGLRLPRAEVDNQASNASRSHVSHQGEIVSTVNRSANNYPTTVSKSEPGLLTNVMNSLSTAGLQLFGRSETASKQSVATVSKKVDDESDELIVLSEDGTEVPTQINSAPNQSDHNSASAEDGAFKFDYKPTGSTDILTLTSSDLDCLAPDAFLNDTIINFYLKYLYYEQLTELQRHSTYLFNCFFYSRLAGNTASSNSSTTGSPDSKNQTKPSPSVLRHANVAKWTRRVDLFSKDYIIIPINESSHWFLGLVCYPWMAGMVSYTALYRAEAFDLSKLTDEFADVDQIEFPHGLDDKTVCMAPVERKPNHTRGEAFDKWRRRRLAWLRKCGINAMPCILLFDSLPCQSRVSNLHVIRDYFQVEWDSRRSELDGPLYFNKDTIRGFSPRVPSQSNLIDCGIYLLHYVEMFFKKPVNSYTKDYFQNEMSSWFSAATIGQKRVAIRNLIKRLEADSHRMTLLL